MKSLLERGADINEKSFSSGCTALMWAAHHGRIDVVQLLLDRGADITCESREGFTALTMAESGGWAEIAQLLKGADEPRRLREAAEKARAAAEEEARIKWVSDPRLHRPMPVPKLLRPKTATARQDR